MLVAAAAVILAVIVFIMIRVYTLEERVRSLDSNARWSEPSSGLPPMPPAHFWNESGSGCDGDRCPLQLRSGDLNDSQAEYAEYAPNLSHDFPPDFAPDFDPECNKGRHGDEGKEEDGEEDGDGVVVKLERPETPPDITGDLIAPLDDRVSGGDVAELRLDTSAARFDDDEGVVETLPPPPSPHQINIILDDEEAPPPLFVTESLVRPPRAGRKVDARTRATLEGSQESSDAEASAQAPAPPPVSDAPRRRRKVAKSDK